MSPGSLPLRTLTEACPRLAAEHRDRVAFRSLDGAVRFDQFDVQSNQVAAGLAACGVGPGDRVALLAKDSLACYEILFGCAKLGAVLTPINWRLTPAEVQYIVADSEARVLFLGDTLAALRDELHERIPALRTIINIHPADGVDEYVPWREISRLAIAPVSAHEDDAVLQIYTSGTTGHPKGVVLAHRTFFRLLEGMREAGDAWMGLSPTDTLLLSLPQFHIGGAWWAVQGFLAGATGVLLDAFHPAKALALIERNRITKVPMVPAMIQLVLAEPSLNTTDLSSVTGFLYGGSPIALALLRQARQVFRCDFFQIYGMTETGNMAVCLRPDDHADGNEHRWLAAGKPLPGVELKIVDRDGRQLPPGETGEICMRSPSQMLGYWKNPAATDSTLVDGWIHSGDAGHLDHDGYLYVCDRIKDMIIYAGENIFPAEIEAALSAHPAILEAAVIGVPDERWGESIKAIVALRPGQTLNRKELIQFARQRLADFKIPKSYDFVDRLPRNPSGKVLKRTLREPYWADCERRVN